MLRRGENGCRTAATVPDDPPKLLTDDEVRALQPVMLAFARRSVRDVETARELVQEALLAAVAAQDGFAHRSRLRTWVVGILSHKIADLFRRRKREPLLPGDDDGGPELLSPPSQSPEKNASRRESLAVIERALGTIPELERLAVLMVDVEDLDHAEACNALGVKPTHLRVLLHRGRHRLRKALEDAAL